MNEAAASVPVSVNGSEVILDDPREGMLLFALREQLGLKGARPGCGIGECGACTVLVDGVPTTSCNTPLASVAGTQVTTPEGLGDRDALHPIQEAFLDTQAAQCGYCINGMMMTVAALDARDGEVTDDELVAALDAHICRCGTHPRILQAARRALDPTSSEFTHSEDGLLCSSRSSCEVRHCAVAEAATDAEPIPREIERAPAVERWLTLLEDGRVELHSGRSELGQGVHTALGQIAAAQLGLPSDAVLVRSASTGLSPDEDYTAGSRSLQQGGVAVGMAAVAFRRILLDRAAAHLDVPVEGLRLEAGGTVVAESGESTTFAELSAGVPVTGVIEPTDQPAWVAAPIGSSPRRPDLVAKLTGGSGYIHDFEVPGMLYARAVLPPTYEAELDELDTAGVESLPGIVTVVRDGRVVIVVAEQEEQAIRAVASLEARARWTDPGLAFTGSAIETFRALPTEKYSAREDDGVDAALQTGRRSSASYSKTYQAHGAMAPSCAVAQFDGDHLTVWSHTQGVFPLRNELATLLDTEREDITVVHVAGPGSYGHNCADDVAAFAATAARALPGRAVRFQFSIADEFGWEPQGSAMSADLEASVDAQGCIVGWRHRTLTDSHAVRPRGEGDRLSLAWLRERALERAWGGPSEGGGRNTIPLYDIPAVEAVADHVRGPLRTGSLRSLGAFFNVFAMESFVDELADAAGMDPVAFRLHNLRDARARAVLEAAAEKAGWQPHEGPSGRGQGVALARYHDTAAYLAMVVDVSVDFAEDVISVDRIVMAVDAGAAVNPEGLRQQLEGGAVQGLSRTMREAVSVDRRGIHSRDWSTYPVVRFADVPRIEVVVLHRPGSPPLGAGEASTPTVAAAIANAIDDASGIRLRALPFTVEAVRNRLLELDDAEMARVLME